ncbi:MAG: MFS transporter [Alicyclobacillus sp.]|nr:MFS transporter [Alicyclobacillus sp.]
MEHAVADPAVGRVQPQKKRDSLSELWLITIGHSLTHWYPSTFYLLLPIIGKELGLDYKQIGFIMTCQYLVSTISNFPGGMIVDRVGRKGLLMAVSLCWVGVPYLLMSLTHSYWALLLCIALVGIGNNLWHPTAIPTLSNRYPSKKGFVLSVHGMGGNAGDALAPLAIGALLTGLALTWRQVVVINVLPGILVAILLFVTLRHLQMTGKRGEKSAERPQAKMSNREYFKEFGKLLKNRALMILSISSAFRSMTQNALLTFLPLYLAHEMGLKSEYIGMCMFLLQTAGFVAAPIAGHMSDRMGPKRILNTTMLMTFVVLIFMALAGKSLWFIVFIAVLGFFLYAVRPVMQAWLMDATPKKMAGSSVGIFWGIQSAGQGLSPLLGGIVADHFGIHAVFYFIAFTILVANVMVLLAPTTFKENDAPATPA